MFALIPKFFEQKNTSLKYLDLSHNSLDEQAGLHLGPAIAANEWLDSLNLSWNHLRHKGAYSIALSLKVCDPYAA